MNSNEQIIHKLGGLTYGGWIALSIVLVILTALIAGIATFFLARRMFTKQLKENPPINEAMIRALYSQVGRKPSEAQIKAIMRSVNKSSNT